MDDIASRMQRALLTRFGENIAVAADQEGAPALLRVYANVAPLPAAE